MSLSPETSTYCMPRCLEGEAWSEQPVTGDTDRPRKRRSMEGSRGFRRLTGQKAEPPCGVKLTLFGSGQDGWRRGSSWHADLEIKKGFIIKTLPPTQSHSHVSPSVPYEVSSQTWMRSQPSGGSRWKEKVLFGRGEDEQGCVRGSSSAKDGRGVAGDRHRVSQSTSSAETGSAART